MNFSSTQKFNIIASLSMITFLMGMGVDLYVPSLPAITHYFSSSNHLVQFTVGIYMLGYSFGQIFLGVLSDSLGRKKVLLISGFFYTLISFLSAFSPNVYVLITCRFLQGIGIAGLGVVGRTIMVDCFSGLELSKIMSCMSAGWALGPIIGPVIGGYLQHYFNWQANFYFFGFYGLVVFVYVLFAVPETNQNRFALKLPKLYANIKTILINPVFILGTILASLTYSVLVVFNTIGPFLIQTTLGYSAVDYGHMALFLGLGYFIGNFFDRIVISYITPMKVSLIAAIIVLAVSILMSIIATFGINLPAILIPIFFIFILCGFMMPNLVAKCVGLFPKIAGTASSLFGTFMGGGVFIMTVIATTLKTNTQLPLSIMYIAIFTLCLILFFVIRRVDN